MDELFVDRRAQTNFGRLFFLGVWIAVAIVYLLGIPVLSLVIVHNLDDAGTLSGESKIKLSLVACAIVACVHGLISLVYVFFREFPILIVRVEKHPSGLEIQTMRGGQHGLQASEIAYFGPQHRKSFCWYKPYSLAVLPGGITHVLRFSTNQTYMLPRGVDAAGVAAAIRSI